MNKNKKEWVIVGILLAVFWLVVMVSFFCDLRSCQYRLPANI